MSERERFEAWAESLLERNYKTELHAGDGYDDGWTDEVWDCWQAASAGREELREALTYIEDELHAYLRWAAERGKTNSVIREMAQRIDQTLENTK